MGLQKKTTLALGIVLMVLMAVLYFGASRIILEGFASLEKHDAQDNVERVLLALAESASTLETTSKDWGYWDSTYVFAQDRNEAYIEENLTPGAMATLRISMLAFVDADGRLVWSGALNLEEPSEFLPEEDFIRLYGDLTFLPSTQDLSGARSGIVLPEGAPQPQLVAFAPILTSHQQGPARGIIVMGQILDESKVEKLATTLKMNLALVRADRLDDDPEQSGIVRELSHDAEYVIRILDDQALAAYGLVSDLEGRPALLAKVSMTRDIHREATRSTVLVAALLAVTGVLVLLSILLLLRKLVLTKLERSCLPIPRIHPLRAFH